MEVRLWLHLGPDRPTLPPMCTCFPHCSRTSRQTAPRGRGGGGTAGTPEPSGGASLRRLFWSVLPHTLPDLIKGTLKHGLTVEDLIMAGINYLDTRSDFWRQQKPIYARERDRKLMQEKWLRERKRRPSQTARYILKSLEEVDMCGWHPQRGGPCPGREGAAQ